MRHALLLTLISSAGSAAAAQVPARLAADRASFADWLGHAPISPRGAIGAMSVDGTGGPLELGDRRSRRVTERAGVVWLDEAGSRRALPRNRPIPIGGRIVLLAGEPHRSRLIIFGTITPAAPPAYYPYDARLVFEGPLVPPASPASERVLTADGIDMEATSAGSIGLSLGGSIRLKVLRIPDASTEESSLEIYFRDATSGAGSYPAGRFVTLDPLPDGRYRLDFNRARNPFCAYNANYPCPVPWRGNTIAAAVRAGERYVTHP